MRKKDHSVQNRMVFSYNYFKNLFLPKSFHLSFLKSWNHWV